MKILVVSQYFRPETFAINGWVQALHNRGAEVTVLTGQPNYPDGKIFPSYAAWKAGHEKFGAIDVWRVPLFPRGQGSAVRLALNYLSFVASGAIFGPWLLRGQRFDVVFVYGTSPILQALPGILLGRVKHAPVTVWVQDLWPESLSATGFIKNKTLLSAVSAIVRFIYRACDAILIQSQAFRAPIERLAGQGKKLHYLPNTVEQAAATEPTPAALAAAQTIRERFSIVFAGNLGVAQSLETVLDAAELLKENGDIFFQIVGSGSRDTWLASEIERRKLPNVCMLGRFPFQDMSPILQAASVLLVTLKDEPIFAYTVPSKIQAYLAAGRPLIACLNGEGARLVEEAGAGKACAAEDAKGLADAVMRLYSMSDTQRAALGDAGRRYFMENFESGKLTDQLLGLFGTLKHKGKRQQ